MLKICFAHQHSIIWQESRSVSYEYVSPHLTVLFTQACQTLKSTTQIWNNVYCSWWQTSFLWFSIKNLISILSPEVEFWHLKSRTCSKYLKRCIISCCLDSLVCLNPWISNNQSLTVCVSGYSGSAGCFLQPRRWRLQPNTSPPSLKWWRVARGGAGSLWQRVHPEDGWRWRETRGHSLAWAESGDNYWPLRGDSRKLFSIWTQPELTWWVAA